MSRTQNKLDESAGVTEERCSWQRTARDGASLPEQRGAMFPPTIGHERRRSRLTPSDAETADLVPNTCSSIQATSLQVAITMSGNARIVRVAVEFEAEGRTFYRVTLSCGCFYFEYREAGAEPPAFRRPVTCSVHSDRGILHRSPNREGDPPNGHAHS